jgi:hypothetical protein
LTNAANSFEPLVFNNTPDATTNNFWRIRNSSSPHGVASLLDGCWSSSHSLTHAMDDRWLRA